MAEYIDRDAVYTAFANACTDVLERASKIYYISGFSYERVIEILDNIPAADVAPAVHGRWKCHGDCGVTECSACGWGIEEYVGDYAYCPNCGTKMDER